MLNQWSQEAYIHAYRFAAHAHRQQFYPGTELPYIMHLSFVCMEIIAALNVEKELNGDLAIQCALLHDTIEDTDTTFVQINAEFGEAVATGILALSKDQSIERSLQMEDSLQRIKQQPREIWMVKLADRITNLQAPPKHWTQEKIAHYREEATQIYEVLKDASTFLAQRLHQKITAYKTFLT